LHSTFIGRAMLGETVTGRAKITKRGRTIINAEAEIRNVKNQLLSRATSNLVSMNQVVEIFEEERQSLV
jgi:acyl-coenzyme A thioesterase PaaI-like protein